MVRRPAERPAMQTELRSILMVKREKKRSDLHRPLCEHESVRCAKIRRGGRNDEDFRFYPEERLGASLACVRVGGLAVLGLALLGLGCALTGDCIRGGRVCVCV